MINLRLSAPEKDSSHRRQNVGKIRTRGGFTIIELLIATSVFSVVLLLIAEGILAFNQAYYKGITQSNTQNTARSALENISQAIQFDGGQVTGAIKNNGLSQGFCINNQRYSYLPGWQLNSNPNASDNQAYHALVVDTVRSNCTRNTKAQNLQHSSLHAGSTELLSPNMRVANLTVSQVSGSTTDLYKIDLRVVYGDNGLLSSPPTASGARCAAAAGSQFCAVSELSTVVEQRIP